MIQTYKLFKIGLRQIVRDGMLLALLPAPFLIGIVVKFGMPAANTLLEQHLSFSLIPWYSLADAMLMALTPMMLAMACAFLLLEEKDEGTGMYYQITPVQGYAYLLARIGLPMLWAFVCTIIVTLLFGISHTTLPVVVTTALISALMGVALSMMIVTLSGNKVEGLAVSKLTGLSLLGLLAVWFAPAPYQYFGTFLPTFWIGELVRQGANGLPFAAGLLTCFLWIYVFINKFLRKI